MKRKINATEFATLSEELKKHYKQDGDNYVLNLADDDDPDALRRARDREKQAAADEKKRADDLQKKLDDITNTSARKAGDIDLLEKSWKDKLDKVENELKTKLAEKDKHLQKILVESKALTIASEIAGDNAHLLVPIIEKRLQADFDGSEPKTRVLDAEGKVSALSMDDLKKEFVDNPKFSAIIIASNATGGASSKDGKGNRQAVPTGKKFHELNDAERTDWHKRDPEGFLKAAESARNQTATRRM